MITLFLIAHLSAVQPVLRVNLPDGEVIEAERVELRGTVVTVYEAALFRDGFE